ncbi:CheR family methyltransferase [Pectinatus haikarae]|uniref:protein-glutamate O-methyltransferase n=1 Tax=Pectinatus haikarae TaxID=349096 RepID=A0ABT9Y914_9FIRM|nr:protein-glutamate O-methyltransferase CheR [Pectinatus haikarae]MDQ0204334.1 chemotaxis protein methyltransferase CheR [Pectinatus haikarae]
MDAKKREQALQIDETWGVPIYTLKNNLEGGISQVDERDWIAFKQKLKSKTGIDLDLYKEAQMKRRINNLVTRKGYSTFSSYFDFAVKDKDEFASFIEYLTINVSEFFRTPEKFSELESVIIPELLQKNTKLNIWSAGCSIGAEPYSIAMILDEKTPGARHRILASDLDVDILAKAKDGVYSDNELKAISLGRKQKYFTKTDDGRYAVSPTIKAKIEFRRHNLLKDSFETGFDLILCRNVVIYFTEEAKDKLYKEFFKALKPGGILFVGGTEAVLNYRDMGYENHRPFFYRRPL